MRSRLQSGSGEIGKAVAGIVLRIENEDRASLGREQGRVQGREPAQHLPGEPQMRPQLGSEVADPAAGRDDDRACFDDLSVGADADSGAERLDIDYLRRVADFGAVSLGQPDEFEDRAFGPEKPALRLKQAGPTGGQAK